MIELQNQLCDYADKILAPLLPVYEIKNDIIKGGIRRLKFKFEKQKEICSKLDLAGGVDERDCAKNILEVLRNRMLQLLFETYGKTLKNKGIKVNPKTKPRIGL